MLRGASKVFSLLYSSTILFDHDLTYTFADETSRRSAYGIFIRIHRPAARAQAAIDGPKPSDADIAKRVKDFEWVKPRDSDTDGSVETIDGVEFTHHFVDVPGDYDTIRWHYVTCGPSDGIPVVFLHGIPDSWYQWHPQMAALSSEHPCIGVDLKGYGQSDKTPGDYRHEGVVEQMYRMLLQIGLSKFYIASHDCGTVQADFMIAAHPESVLWYARGEQQFYHFNPILGPQETVFRDAPWSGFLEDTKSR